MTEHESTVSDRQKVVDHDVSPDTESPKPEMEYAGMPRIPVLFSVINDHLKKKSS
jgi:hypothetical protein